MTWCLSTVLCLVRNLGQSNLLKKKWPSKTYFSFCKDMIHEDSTTLQTLLYDEMQQRLAFPRVFSSVTKRCQFSYCLTVPTYGYKFNESTHCSVHKELGMWKTSMPKKSKRKDTSTPGRPMCYVCNIRANFGNLSSERRYCKAHMNPLTDWKITTCMLCKQVATYIHGVHTYCERHASSKCTRIAVPKVEQSEVFEDVPVCLDIQYNPAVVENPLEVELRLALEL